MDRWLKALEYGRQPDYTVRLVHNHYSIAAHLHQHTTHFLRPLEPVVLSSSLSHPTTIFSRYAMYCKPPSLDSTPMPHSQSHLPAWPARSPRQGSPQIVTLANLCSCLYVTERKVIPSTVRQQKSILGMISGARCGRG